MDTSGFVLWGSGTRFRAVTRLSSLTLGPPVGFLYLAVVLDVSRKIVGWAMAT